MCLDAFLGAEDKMVSKKDAASALVKCAVSRRKVRH